MIGVLSRCLLVAGHGEDDNDTDDDDNEDGGKEEGRERTSPGWEDAGFLGCRLAQIRNDVAAISISGIYNQQFKSRSRLFLLLTLIFSSRPWSSRVTPCVRFPFRDYTKLLVR